MYAARLRLTALYLFQNKIPTMIAITMPAIARRSGIIVAVITHGIVLLEPVPGVKVREGDITQMRGCINGRKADQKEVLK